MIIKQSKTKFIFLLILFLSVFILLDPRLFVAEDVDFEMKAILGVIALVCVAGSVFIIA